MIKLKRPDKPSELTDDKVKELTDKFIETEKNVWRQPYIVDTLLEMSYHKCSYCETLLNTQSREMHVEHFHCKSKYPKEVILWENLIPACRQCNSNKGTTDTYEHAFINPTIDDPKDYLYLKNCMILSKDNHMESKGRFTIDLLGLNHRERLMIPRFKVLDVMNQALYNIHEKALECNQGQNIPTKKKNAVCNGIKDLLKMAQPESEYSAFTSTIVLDNDDFNETISILKNLSLLDSEHDELLTIAKTVKLDTHK